MQEKIESSPADSLFFPLPGDARRAADKKIAGGGWIPHSPAVFDLPVSPAGNLP